MIKFRVFFDPVKEENWVNDVQAQGYRLKSNTLDMLYTFEETDETYLTRIDYQDYLSKKDFDEYVEIHEEFGWTHIRGGRYGLATQMWSKVPDGNDKIFSDRDSKINFYKRYMGMTGALAVILFIYTIIFVFPLGESQLFLTPGLWDLPAGQFWPAFLFELPFAILRILPELLFPILIILLFIVYVRMAKVKKGLDQEN